MRKIIFLIIASFFIFSGVSASVEEGTYFHSDGSYATLSGSNVKVYNSGATLLFEKNFPSPFSDLKHIQFNAHFYGKQGALYLHNNGTYWANQNNGTWQSFGTANGEIRQFTSGGNDIWCVSLTSGTCYGLSDSNMTSKPNASTTFFSNGDGEVMYNNEILSKGVPDICTLENIPRYQNINIQPTSSGAITEYIEDPTEKVYAYSTSLSGDYPLQVIFLDAKNVSGFSDFSIQQGRLVFDTNFFGFGKQAVMSFSARTGIQYIKMLGSYGKVDIITYREDNKTIKNTYRDIDLNNFESGFGYPIANDDGQTVIVFRKAYFQKYIDTLEVYTSGTTDTVEVEICERDDGSYTVDGIDYYEGENPYIDLVGDPDPSPVELSLYNDGYTFFENGFCLKNFAPYPKGGELYFQIKNPMGELKKTYSLYPSGLQRYGNNTCTPITTNYHITGGKYYVKAFYLYKGVVYEVNENFTTYEITTPEFIGNEVNPWADVEEACGVSNDQTGFMPGVSRFFACMSETASTFFSNQFQAVKHAGGFLYKMSNIFTTEVKDFSLVSGVYASEPLSNVMNFSETQEFKDSVFGKIKKLLWGVIITMGVVVSIGIIIYVKQND